MAQDSRISTKALLVGVAVDLVGSSLFGAVVGFCWAIVNARQGAAPFPMVTCPAGRLGSGIRTTEGLM